MCHGGYGSRPITPTVPRCSPMLGEQLGHVGGVLADPDAGGRYPQRVAALARLDVVLHAHR